MQAALHRIWGCGRGPVSRVAPQSRILAGGILFVACMLAPVPSRVGLALVCTGVVGWVFACGTPLRVVRSAVLLGFVLFLPYYLLLPLMVGDPGAEDWATAAQVPTGILVHGLAGMLISLATITTLSASDLCEGLLRLPVPGLVSAILLQVVHQTAELSYETRRIADAIALRGASGSGLGAVRLLFSLPKVWLPRVLVRAERVADSLEVRGYCEKGLASFGDYRLGLRDAATLGLSATALALAGAMRYWLVR